MSKIIPVMVHHETGEKAQAAGKKNQEYLKYCIAQAKKYNEKVVLLGDEYNKAWCDDWHNANDFITEKWTKFHAVFENLSTIFSNIRGKTSACFRTIGRRTTFCNRYF